MVSVPVNDGRTLRELTCTIQVDLAMAAHGTEQTVRFVGLCHICASFLIELMFVTHTPANLYILRDAHYLGLRSSDLENLVCFISGQSSCYAVPAKHRRY